MHATAQDWIAALDLQPHPLEGGYFRETYRSAAVVLGGTRSLNTAIYYLLTGDGVSEMHQLPGDEVYHYYAGDPLETLLLHADGRSEIVHLGADVSAGQRPQLVIPGGTWQGSVRYGNQHGYTLIGATMAPGFDAADYIRAARDELTAHWPKLERELTVRTPHG